MVGRFGRIGHMTFSEALLPEFDQEMAHTRKTLERVPEGTDEWKPHAKSMSMGRLAGHLAELPHWAVETIQREELDVMPPGSQPPTPFISTSQAVLLDRFDKNVAEARALLAGVTDDDILKPWSLLVGGKTVLTMPRAAVIRGVVMNHMIHHRAQLGVYLRLNDVPVPSVYGPSADENRLF
jgi:uncharacterized damage-inducible protein DinB